MKNEELKLLKEKYEQFKKKQNEVLNFNKEIELLKETKEVKRYLELLNILDEVKKGINYCIDKYTDKEIIDIALRYTEITPDEDIYVYFGTYKCSDVVDVIHYSSDIMVGRNNKDADYVLYKNLESKYFDDVQVPYRCADEFEKTHKIIIPQNAINREKYFYDLRSEYFETMVLKSPEEARENIKKLIKK